MDQTILLVAFIALMAGFMFWSQRRAKKRYEEKIESLMVGDHVVTIGGIYGQLTAVDRDANQARLKIAPDVEIQIGLSAVSRQIEPAESSEQTDE
jgi:preprotein translocase subunit YajC